MIVGTIIIPITLVPINTIFHIPKQEKYQDGLKNQTNYIPYVSCSQLFKDGTFVRMSLDSSINSEILLCDSNSNLGQIYSDSFYPQPFKKLDLCIDAKRSLSVANAGGSSVLSEALSIYYFRNRYKGTDFILEKEMEYWIDYKMCDFLVKFNGQNYGISVTRAFNFHKNTVYSNEKAEQLLTKKLDGLILARHCVAKKHRFKRCILHIWAESINVQKHLDFAYLNIKNNNTEFYNTIKDVIILITICNERYIYTDILT